VLVVELGWSVGKRPVGVENSVVEDVEMLEERKAVGENVVERKRDAVVPV
jgi:hypothetical protein